MLIFDLVSYIQPSLKQTIVHLLFSSSYSSLVESIAISVKPRFCHEHSRSAKGTEAAPPYCSISINTAEFWSFRQIPSATQPEHCSPGKSNRCTCCGRFRFAKVAERSQRVTWKPYLRCGLIVLSRQSWGSAQRVRTYMLRYIFSMRVLTRSFQDRGHQSAVCNGPCWLGGPLACNNEQIHCAGLFLRCALQV